MFNCIFELFLSKNIHHIIRIYLNFIDKHFCIHSVNCFFDDQKTSKPSIDEIFVLRVFKKEFLKLYGESTIRFFLQVYRLEISNKHFSV